MITISILIDHIIIIIIIIIMIMIIMMIIMIVIMIIIIIIIIIIITIITNVFLCCYLILSGKILLKFFWSLEPTLTTAIHREKWVYVKWEAMYILTILTKSQKNLWNFSHQMHYCSLAVLPVTLYSAAVASETHNCIRKC